MPLAERPYVFVWLKLRCEANLCVRLPSPSCIRSRQSVLNGTALPCGSWQNIFVKRKKSKKQRDQATIASVTKEMAGPRFAGSARKEEEAIHGVMKHGNLTCSERTGP